MKSDKKYRIKKELYTNHNGRMMYCYIVQESVQKFNWFGLVKSRRWKSVASSCDSGKTTISFDTKSDAKEYMNRLMGGRV